MTFFSKSIGILCALVVAGSFSYADAAVLRSGDVVSVPQDAKVEGDFYAAGNEVHISGIVAGDVYVAGGTVTIDGAVGGDVVVAGGTVTIHGSVGDDVRVVGGKTTLASAVSGDVLALSGSLSVLSSATVGGDVLVYGGRADIAGAVTGAIHARAESLSVGASAGSVDAVLERGLQLTSGANIAGDVSYQSMFELAREPDSTVGGKVYRKDAQETEGFVASHITLWFMTLFSALVSVLLFRETFLALLVNSTPRFGLCGLLGLGVLCVTPIAFGLLFLSVLGLLVGALLFLVYASVVIGGLIAVHVFVGAFLAKIVVKEYKVNWFWTVAGVVVTQSVLLVPIVGPLLLFVAFVMVIGMLIFHAYTQWYA